MGERKVLNKYFPPDFDPTKMPRMKKVRSEDKQMKVRMMLPMTVRCNVCGTFMYKGTKFNTRMEDVRGEDYLGIKIFRFYYRCTHCSAEFCMKTDPKNADYQLEAGATRNYEPWRDKEKVVAQAVASREEEERGNAMKALENRTLDSRREMDLLAALDEMRSLRARHESVDTAVALAVLKRKDEADAVDLDAEDEAAVKQMLLQRAGFLRRLSDSDEEGPAGEGAQGGADGDRRPGGRTATVIARVRGATVASVASALWDEELSGEASGGSEDTGIDGDAFMMQQFAAARAAAVDEAHGGGSNGGQQQQQQASSDQRGQQQQWSSGEEEDEERQQAGAQHPAAAAAGAGRPPRPPAAPAEKPKPPSALPKFAVRPVAVVVKRKAETEASQPKPAKQQAAAVAAGGEESDGSGGGGGGLIGLAGYGSSSGGESP